VCRWNLDPRQSCRGRRCSKSLDSHELEPEDHALGYSRGGFGAKVHLVTNARGLPLAAELTAGQVNESTQAESVIAWALTYQCRHGQDVRVPKKLIGDKGYSAQRVRQWLAEHGIEPVIARKSNELERESESFDNITYRKRNVIERCVGWLKECRRFGTRFEKLAVRFMAMLQLAIIRRYLRLGFSNSA
jgi:transposase